MNASDYVKAHAISGEMIDGPNSTQDGDGWEQYAITIRLSYKDPHAVKGRPYVLDVPYRMGLGLDVGEFTGSGDMLPTSSVAQVVEAIGGDLRYGRMSYPEFADEFGQWDEQGYRTWEACQAMAKKVYAWCRSEAMADDVASLDPE